MLACHELGCQLDLTAVNHWPVAVETYTANHGTAAHFCQELGAIDPLKAVPGGHLHLLVASPECTHHSNAPGGKRMQDQSRASAWHITRWATALRIDNILIENVPEFRHWGSLGEERTSGQEQTRSDLPRFPPGNSVARLPSGVAHPQRR